MKMIPAKEIDDIATLAAKAALAPQTVQRAFSEPIVDSRGEEALRVTVVVLPGGIEASADEALADTLVRIKQDLLRAGEERFALVEFSTQAELDDAGAEP